jgi:catechol-2,3-dioxygenase
MSTENPSTLSHVLLGTNDFKRATRFYDRVLGALVFRRILPNALAPIVVTRL